MKQSSTFEKSFSADTSHFRADSVSAAPGQWAAVPWVDRSVVLLEQTIRYAQA